MKAYQVRSNNGFKVLMMPLNNMNSKSISFTGLFLNSQKDEIDAMIDFCPEREFALVDSYRRKSKRVFLISKSKATQATDTHTRVEITLIGKKKQ